MFVMSSVMCSLAHFYNLGSTNKRVVSRSQTTFLLCGGGESSHPHTKEKWSGYAKLIEKYVLKTVGWLR